MGKTSIEWTDASWNPITGCRECSPGCANCYAARITASRLKNHPDYRGLAIIDNRHPRFTGEVRFHPERLEEPLHWRKPQRIFVCDMGDLFHESVKDEWIDRIYAVMVDCEHTHTFQILTKRAARMRDYFSNLSADRVRKHLRGTGTLAWPLRNIWCGVSVENQHFADERIPLLLATPAAVRWISAEPLLGPVDLTKLAYWPNPRTASVLNCLRQDTHYGLDWVVCGGESGTNARPMHPDWARSLRDQCEAASVPFFFKQWGQFTYYDAGMEMFKETHRIEVGPGASDRTRLWAVRVGKKKAGRLLDGTEWNEFPRQMVNP